jgi:hypothetical protein
MRREYYVLRGGRVVYPPGHYEKAGAIATAQAELRAHPRSTVTIVKIEEVLYMPKDDPRCR